MYICINASMKNAAYIQIDYDHLTALAKHLAGHIDRSEATISTWCVGHARLFSRLRLGKGCNAHTYRDAMEWFAKNWPADLEWPQDIPRPSLNKTEKRVS